MYFFWAVYNFEEQLNQFKESLNITKNFGVSEYFDERN